MERWFKMLFPAGVAALLEQISGKNQVAMLQTELSSLRHEVVNASNSRSELKGYLETYKMLEGISVTSSRFTTATADAVHYSLNGKRDLSD